MFRRLHHERIAQILRSMDADLLRSNNAVFGGGTLAALRFGEYRTSVDIDFLVSDIQGYRSLREAVKRGGLKSLFSSLAGISIDSHVATDQYGIRGTVLVLDTPVKLEIVAEGRVELDQIDTSNDILGVAALSNSDLLCQKLLANSDRFLDSSTFNRDLLDIAFMEPRSIRTSLGWQKAEGAYGGSIARDFERAAAQLLDDPAWLRRCLEQLEIAAPRALVYKLIEQIAKKK